ncbi:helix-turn-helix domain-containing protein [Flavilitoribacter nigricans]|uniref:helix-turn-helix domain-containing protein n=1 Tax=Flavilitoribacter nigricans TaxID=70997 RepID=UPI00117A6320|nr:helix-turn-helix domain-containing protein [Flavilitoribacter nigricans]
MATGLLQVPDQRFYRLWIVEDHIDWATGVRNQELDLAETLWFFPKHFKPGIPLREVEGFTFWFDDTFLTNNPMLERSLRQAAWGAQKPFLISSISTFPAIRNLCHDHQEYLSGSPYQQNSLAYTTATLLVLHLWQVIRDQFQFVTAGHKSAWTTAFLSLIEEHYTQQHQPSFYARQLNLSLPTLRRHCREALNQSPSDLIQHRLVEEAKRLLLDSDSSIKEIAFSLGFEDESYFVRFFRQQVLLPPRAYRRSFLPL